MEETLNEEIFAFCTQTVLGCESYVGGKEEVIIQLAKKLKLYDNTNKI